MQQKFFIVIADKNRHVREFLKREFESDGYVVSLAKDETELLSLLNNQDAADLIILDLEMPCCEGVEIFEHLVHCNATIPIIVHTLLTEYFNHSEMQKAAAILEKTGANVDHLKSVVISVLKNHYPDRFHDALNYSELSNPL